MKQPKLNDVRIDKQGTKRLRSEMARSKKIKITINIDDSSLQELRKISGKTGVPYQTLLNRVLREGLQVKKRHNSRLDRLERMIKELQEKIAA